MVRVGPADHEDALARLHARPMDFTGRPLKGMVYVDPPGYRTDAALAKWIHRGIDFVSARVRNYQFHPYSGIIADQLWLRGESG